MNLRCFMIYICFIKYIIVFKFPWKLGVFPGKIPEILGFSFELKNRLVTKDMIGT